MLYMEIIVVCSEIYTKHINTLCGQNVALWMLSLISLNNARSTRSSQAACCLWHSVMLHAETLEIKNKAYTLLCKVEIKQWINFENLWAVYLWSQYTAFIL